MSQTFQRSKKLGARTLAFFQNKTLLYADRDLATCQPRDDRRSRGRSSRSIMSWKRKHTPLSLQSLAHKEIKKEKEKSKPNDSYGRSNSKRFPSNANEDSL